MILAFDSFVHEKTAYDAVESPVWLPTGVEAWLRHDYLAANLSCQTLNIRTQQQESLSIHVSGFPVSSLCFDTLYLGDATDLFIRFVTDAETQLVRVLPGRQAVTVTFDPPQDPFDLVVFAESYTHAANIEADNFHVFSVPEPAFPLWIVAALVLFVCFRRHRTQPPRHP